MVDGLKHEVLQIRKHMEQTVFEQAWAYPDGLLKHPEAAPAPTSAENTAAGPDGHRVKFPHRETGFGSVFAHTHLLVKGNHNSSARPVNRLNPVHSAVPEMVSSSFRSKSYAGGEFSGFHSKLPKLHFPKFNGDNPKLWETHSENYFNIYDVDPPQWVKVATMHFEGVAACWLQSVERKLHNASWSELCRLIHDCFGHEQHELLIRQLFHIKQTGSVADYIAKFFELVDQLSGYSSETDPLYYTMSFIDGLRDDIKPIVLVQRPPDFNTACALAALKEEVAEPLRRKEFRKPDSGFLTKPVSKGLYPLPHPPRLDKVTAPSQAEDKRGVESSRAQYPAEKLAALGLQARQRPLSPLC
uniref:Retrotransposon gag domain-containing protein n=1 Tax=Arundo donax TaxID=35708 RepID=A0A0A8ZCB4_ARUDO